MFKKFSKATVYVFALWLGVLALSLYFNGMIFIDKSGIHNNFDKIDLGTIWTNSTFWINFVLFAVAFGVFIFSAFSFNKLKSFRYDFGNNKEPEDMKFDDSDLKEEYSNFVGEKDDLERSNKYTCNIEDYINKELIDSISEKYLLNLVPGVMIGLGILGTFVGLTFALQEFNFGTVEEIEKSIGPLMNGIKIAFHTSIYGMIFSLVFNWILKGIYAKTYSALDRFLSKCGKYSKRQNEKNVFDAIDQLSFDIVQKLSKKIEYKMDDLKSTTKTNTDKISSDMNTGIGQFSKIIPQSFDSLKKPIDEVLKGSVSKTLDSIDGRLKKIVDNQMTSLEQIVDKFIEKMDDALGNNFNKLRESIKNILDDQRILAISINNILSRVEASNTHMEAINKSWGGSLEVFGKYIGDLENMQGNITNNLSKNIDSLIKNSEKQNKRNEELNNKINSLIQSGEQYGQNISEASKSFTSKITVSVTKLEELQAKLNSEIDKIDKNFDGYIQKTNALSDDLTNKSKDCLQSVSDEHMKKLNTVSNNISTKVDNMLQFNRQELQKVVETQKLNLNEFKNEFQKTVDETFKNIDKRSATQSDILKENMKSNLNAISEKSQETVKSIENTSKQCTQEIKTSFEKIVKGIVSENDRLLRTFREEVLPTFREEMKNSVGKFEQSQKMFEDSQKKIQSAINSSINESLATFKQTKNTIEKTEQSIANTLKDFKGVSATNSKDIHEVADKITEHSKYMQGYTIEIIRKLDENKLKTSSNTSEVIKSLSRLGTSLSSIDSKISTSTMNRQN